MSLHLKDPGATLDYAIDWGSDYLSGDVIATSAWTVDPVEPGGVAIESSQADLLVATVSASGGLSGRRYRLTNHIETASGRADSRSIMLRVEQR